MKLHRFSLAHCKGLDYELVCSNSLRGEFENAVGLQGRAGPALFMQAADATCVPAGGALVDREPFPVM
jgi:folate-dependent tRNA-U54 methylase TrmFO/GidA